MNFENLYYLSYETLITNVKIEPYKDYTDLVIFSYDYITCTRMESSIYINDNYNGSCDYSEHPRMCNGHYGYTYETVTGEPSVMHEIGSHHESIVHPSKINISKCYKEIPQYTHEDIAEKMREHKVVFRDRIKELNDKAEAAFKAREADQKAFQDIMNELTKEVESESIWDFLRSLFKRNKK